MVQRVHNYANGGSVQPQFSPKYQAKLDALKVVREAAAPIHKAKAAAEDAQMARSEARMRARMAETKAADRSIKYSKVPTRETSNAAARAARAGRAAAPVARAAAGRGALAALGRAGAVGAAGAAGYAVGTALNDKYKISDKIVDAVSPDYDPNAKEK